MGIMTVKEASVKWGITPRRIQEIIRSGRIKNLQKIGTTWVMPDDTLKPPDMRLGDWKRKRSLKRIKSP